MKRWTGMGFAPNAFGAAMKAWLPDPSGMGSHVASPAGLRWVGIAILAASLLAMAALPGVEGFAVAAAMWIVGFVLFERGSRP